LQITPRVKLRTLGTLSLKNAFNAPSSGETILAWTENSVYPLCFYFYMSTEDFEIFKKQYSSYEFIHYLKFTFHQSTICYFID
jgi:hypothetical protein